MISRKGFLDDHAGGALLLLTVCGGIAFFVLVVIKTLIEWGIIEIPFKN